jgi:O-antigen/teichoic acid export membrane protein
VPDGSGDDAPVARSGSRANALWTVFDQVVSSGTNAAINFVIARRVGSAEFGAFAIAYTIFAMVVGLSRAAGTAPLGITYADASASAFRRAVRGASGTSLALGAVTGVGLLLVGAGLRGTVGLNLAAMGLIMPALLVQDAWRYASFALGRPLLAVANDLVWAAALGLGVVLLTVLAPGGGGGAAALVLIWGVAAGIAALVGVAQHQAWPAPRRARAWFTAHRETTGFMTAEFLSLQGAQQSSTLVIGAVGSTSLVGALRGLQTLLAPTTNLAVALMSFAIPEFSRRKHMPPGAVLRGAYLVSGLVVVSSTLWGLAFMVLPGDFGAALLGDTWSQTHDLLLLAVIAQAGPGLAVGPAAVLYAFGRTRLTFWINLFFVPFLLACPVTGLLISGARGVVIGNIIVYWATIPPWLYYLHRQVRDGTRPRAHPVTT